MCGRSLTFHKVSQNVGASPLLVCSHKKSSTRPGHSPEKDIITSRKVKDLPHIERQSRVTLLQTNLTSAKTYPRLSGMRGVTPCFFSSASNISRIIGSSSV